MTQRGVQFLKVREFRPYQYNPKVKPTSNRPRNNVIYVVTMALIIVSPFLGLATTFSSKKKWKDQTAQRRFNPSPTRHLLVFCGSHWFPPRCIRWDLESTDENRLILLHYCDVVPGCFASNNDQQLTQVRVIILITCKKNQKLPNPKACHLEAFLSGSGFLWIKCPVTSVACRLRLSSGIAIETSRSGQRVAHIKAGMSTVTNPSNKEMKITRNPNRYNAVAAGRLIERSCLRFAGLSLKVHFLPQTQAILEP